MKYLLIILCIFSTSCASQKRCTAKFPPQTKRDSIYIEKLTKVPVYIQGDSILIEVPINCPDQSVIISETGKLKQIISILNGKLSSKTNIKAETVFVFKTDTITKTVEVKVPQPVKFIPKIWQVFGWVGIISILLTLAFLFIKFRKIFS